MNCTLVFCAENRAAVAQKISKNPYFKIRNLLYLFIKFSTPGKFLNKICNFITSTPVRGHTTLNKQHYENEGKCFNFNGRSCYRYFKLLWCLKKSWLRCLRVHQNGSSFQRFSWKIRYENPNALSAEGTSPFRFVVSALLFWPQDQNPSLNLRK